MGRKEGEAWEEGDAREEGEEDDEEEEEEEEKDHLFFSSFFMYVPLLMSKVPGPKSMLNYAK